MKQSESFSNSSCTDQIHLAERELSAFIAAVTALFGADQARVSVEDWLDESQLMDVSPRSTRRDWRTITIAASVRLANRLNAIIEAPGGFLSVRSQRGHGSTFSFTLPGYLESSLPLPAMSSFECEEDSLRDSLK